MIIYGFNAVREAIRSTPRQVRYIGIDVGSRKGRMGELETEAKAAGIPVRRLQGRQIQTLVPREAVHNGIVAEVADASYADADEVLDREATNLVLLLDEITDPHNLGASLRVANAFGVDLVIVPEHGSAGLTATAVKASAGAASWVPVAQAKNFSRQIEDLKQRGFWIYGADAAGEPVDKVEFAEKTAIVMGSEEKGMRRLVREHCDVIVSIPMAGQVDSLNVSTAAAVLCWEVRKRTN